MAEGIPAQAIIRALGREPNWGCDNERRVVVVTEADTYEAWRRCGGCQPCRLNALIRLAVKLDTEKRCVKCKRVIRKPVLAKDEDERCPRCADS